jgi:hypothetical protein
VSQKNQPSKQKRQKDYPLQKECIVGATTKTKATQLDGFCFLLFMN